MSEAMREPNAAEIRSAALWMEPDELYDDSDKPTTGPCPLLQAIQANASNEAVLARAKRASDPRLLRLAAERLQLIIDDINDQVTMRRREPERNRDWEHRAIRSRNYRATLRRQLLRMADSREGR